MIKKIFIKKQLFNFIIINILMLIIVTNVSFAAINPAINGSDMFNRSMWHGYFYNEQQAWGGDCAGRVLCQGLGSTEKPVNNKEDFINQVKSYWSTGSNKGADFIILTMIGKKPASLNAPMQLSPTQEDVNKWEKLVNDSNIILNDIILDVRWNTYTQNLSNGRHDIAWYDQHTTGTRLTNQPAISFSDSSGKIFYSIRKDCGNPVNAMPGPPPPPGDPKGNLDTFSSVKIGDNNVVATEADSNQAYIDYKDLTNYISFRNYVKTFNLENVKGERLRFKVTTISSNVSLSDPNFFWGAHPYNIGPSEGFVVNPNVIFNNNIGWQNTLADSNSRLKINNKVENLIGNKICRKVEVTSSPSWLNKISTNSEACVTIKGNALETSLVINIKDHEKGSGDKQVQYSFMGGDKVLFCSEAYTRGEEISLRFTRTLFGSESSISPREPIIIKNCEKVGNYENFYTETVSGAALDSLNLDSTQNVIKLTAVLPDRSIVKTQNVKVYEAPFIIFDGNDVRACPFDADKSRFVFKPNEAKFGSRNWLASLWSNTTTLYNNSTSGWSKGLNTNNNNNILNNIKAKGIDCEGISSIPVTSPPNDSIGVNGVTGETVLTGVNTQLEKTATNVYIYDNIKATAPTAPTSKPPKYEINATNVYIDKSVKLLQGVIINATNVYTCSEGTAKVPNNEWHTECNAPLRIEGSVNAQNLYLMRSVGTRYKSDGFSDQKDIPTGSNLTRDPLAQPAEVFVYPAYFYFTNVGASGSGSTKGSIDSYSQAPPRL